MATSGLAAGLIAGRDPKAFAQQQADKQKEQFQLQYAPLQQALQADRQKLTAFMNPDGTVNPDHEKEYQATVDSIADKMGRMRTLFGQPQPGEEPNHFESTIADLTDRLHITRDLAHRLKNGAQVKSAKWGQQNKQMAQDTASGTLPYAMTPEGQELAAKSSSALNLSQNETDQKNKATLDLINKYVPEDQRPKALQEFAMHQAGVSPSKTLKEYTSPDGKERQWFAPEDKPEGWNATQGSAVSGPKVGSLGEFLTEAYGPHPTAQQEIEGRQRWAQATAGTTTGTHVAFVPQPDGSIKAITVETTSHKTIGEPSTPRAQSLKKTVDEHRNGTDGKIVGGRATAAQNNAEKEYGEAVKLSSLADQVAEHPDDAINQKRLAVALERTSAGRFTTQALDYIIKNGWGNTIEQWANNPSTGALPKETMRQLIEGAHQNLKASQDALNALKNMNGPKTNEPKNTQGGKSLADRLNEALQ